MTEVQRTGRLKKLLEKYREICGDRKVLNDCSFTPHPRALGKEEELLVLEQRLADKEYHENI